jgi:NADPH:quinone reductase-like Zn-dependent oxidoreductase
LTNTKVGTGDIVLIHGASGGVGLMAVQLAIARGAKVIATASPARHEQLRSYGAEPVAYGEGLADRVRALGKVDAALDLVGSDEALDTSVELVADRSRIATIAGFGRAAELGIAALTGADGGQAIRDASRADLIALAADGKLEVTVDKVFPLDEAAQAHRYLQTGHARGKVVLVP